MALGVSGGVDFARMLVGERARKVWEEKRKSREAWGGLYTAG